MNTILLQNSKEKEHLKLKEEIECNGREKKVDLEGVGEIMYVNVVKAHCKHVQNSQMIHTNMPLKKKNIGPSKNNLPFNEMS